MNLNLPGTGPDRKTIRRFALRIITAIISAVSTNYGLRLPGSSTDCALLTLGYLFIYSQKLPSATKQQRRWIAAFSFIFSAACIQGALLRITGSPYYGLVKKNYMGYFSFRDAANLCVLAFCTYYLIRLSIPLLQRLNDILHLKRYADQVQNNSEEHYSLVMPMAFLFLCWLPYLFAYYPGFILGDSCSSIRQALRLEDCSNHYPVMYTLLIKLFLCIGDFFGSLTLGCALYSIFQMLFLAYTLAKSVQWLGRRGVPWQACVLVTVFFGITPFFAQISIAMWKDPIFSAAILLWTLLLLDHIRQPKLRDKETELSFFCIDCGLFLKSIFLLLLICLSRNNGIYIVLFCIVTFCLIWRVSGKQHRCLIGLKEVIVSSLLALILCTTITGPVYDAAGVKPTENVERVGIMINQMARTVALSGNLSEKDKAFMKHLMPLKEYRKKYRPCVVDLLKWDDDFNDQYLNQHMDEFYRTWFSMGIKNPRSYLQGWELLTFGYWMPNQWGLYWDGANIIKGNLNDLPFDDQLNDQIHTVYGGKGHQMKSGLRLIFDCKGTIAALGTVSWILLFAVLVVILRKEWSALIALMPSVGLFLTLLLASPYYYWQRYGLAEYYLLPVYIFIILSCSGTENESV